MILHPVGVEDRNPRAVLDLQEILGRSERRVDDPAATGGPWAKPGS